MACVLCLIFRLRGAAALDNGSIGLLSVPTCSVDIFDDRRLQLAHAARQHEKLTVASGTVQNRRPASKTNKRRLQLQVTKQKSDSRNHLWRNRSYEERVCGESEPLGH